MTNADETPAQPTARTGGRCSDQCPTIFGITGPLCALPYGHLGSHESEHGTIWSFMPGVDSEPAVQPDVAPAQSDELVIEAVTPANLEATARATGGGYRSPDIELPDAAPVADGNAGGAGVDVYREAAAAYVAKSSLDEDDPKLTECIYDLSRDDAFRAAIDDARAPLLAEVAAYERHIEELNARVVRECKRIAAERDEAIRERDEYVESLRAQVIEQCGRAEKAEKERDEARAEVAAMTYDEPDERPVTFVDAGGQRIAHSGHHDDAEAIEMARHYWQLAVEDGEIGAACLAAVDAGQVAVTRETLVRDTDEVEPVTDDGGAG